MRIEIVSIGDELLRGKIVNTNATFLCGQLRMNGYKVSLQTTLSDDKQQLLEGLKGALERSDLVIATGGLGPTLDDGTREAAAEIFGSDFHVNEAVAQELKQRYGERYFAVQDQARLPRKATILPNRVGSAPGLAFAQQGKRLILLPGVPIEMEVLFSEEVLPLLRREYAQELVQTCQLFFCLVYESLLDPHLRTLSALYPHVEVGIYPAVGTVTVTLSSVDSQELLLFRQALEKQWSSYLYTAPTGKIEEALRLSCIQRNKKLACAESCTGGQMAAFITSVAGASDYFLGSFVTYSNLMKRNQLGVSEQTLFQKGAVSAEVVEEMLQGVFNNTQADLAIAVSGVAGPVGGTPLHPVGTIYAAIGERGHKSEVGSFRVAGNRGKILSTASLYLIGALWCKLEKGKPVFPFC